MIYINDYSKVRFDKRKTLSTYYSINLVNVKLFKNVLFCGDS